MSANNIKTWDLSERGCLKSISDEVNKANIIIPSDVVTELLMRSLNKDVIRCSEF